MAVPMGPRKKGSVVVMGEGGMFVKRDENEDESNFYYCPNKKKMTDAADPPLTKENVVQKRRGEGGGVGVWFG